MTTIVFELRRRKAPTHHCSDSDSVAERRCYELASAIRNSSFVADRNRLLGDPINHEQLYADLQRVVDGTLKMVDDLEALSTRIDNVADVSRRGLMWHDSIDHVKLTLGKLDTALGCSANTAMVHTIAYTVLSRWAQYECGSDNGALRRIGTVPCTYLAKRSLPVRRSVSAIKMC